MENLEKNIPDRNIAPSCWWNLLSQFPLASLRSSSMLPKNINRMLTPGRSRRKCLNISLTLAELQKKVNVNQKNEACLHLSAHLITTSFDLQNLKNPMLDMFTLSDHNHGSENKMTVYIERELLLEIHHLFTEHHWTMIMGRYQFLGHSATWPTCPFAYNSNPASQVAIK